MRPMRLLVEDCCGRIVVSVNSMNSRGNNVKYLIRGAKWVQVRARGQLNNLGFRGSL